MLNHFHLILYMLQEIFHSLKLFQVKGLSFKFMSVSLSSLFSKNRETKTIHCIIHKSLSCRRGSTANGYSYVYSIDIAYTETLSSLTS